VGGQVLGKRATVVASRPSVTNTTLRSAASAALVLALAQLMTFAAVARLVHESWLRVHAICSRYVDLAVAQADLSAVSAVGIDETSCRRGHDYLTIASNSSVKPEGLPNQSGSICTTRPSGSLTRGVLTSR
jgi:hypothetical protein